MSLDRRRGGVLLLAAAGIFFCAVLLSTASSGGQASAATQAGGGATATAGGDNCVDTGGGSTQQTQGTGEAGNQQTQQSQSQNENSDVQRLQQNDDTGTVEQQGQSQNGSSGDIQQTSQPQDQNQNNDQNNNEDNNTQQSQSQNGDQSNTDQQSQQDQQGTTPSQDAGGNDNCVVANTVPNESLPPTGSSAKQQAGETPKEETNSGHDGKQSGSGSKKTSSSSKTDPKKTDSNSKSGSNSKASPKSGTGSRPQTSSKSGTSSRSVTSSRSLSAPDLAPLLAASRWARPSAQEVASTDKPRRFAPAPGSEMTLSARAMGLYDAPVASYNHLDDLDNGLVRMPETSLPWDRSKQKNVYIAGHYLGVPNTKSRLVFYNLNKLKKGDELVLKDSLGQSYKYRVSEKFAAKPNQPWVMGQVRNRDMLTLQTCIPPDFGKRLIVRADRERL